MALVLGSVRDREEREIKNRGRKEKERERYYVQASKSMFYSSQVDMFPADLSLERNSGLMIPGR